MADVRVILLITLWIVWWPISKLLHGIILVLSPIWTLASFILLPFMHICQAVARIITIPFSGRWLERIETLYIYLGTAGLVGCITGGLIFVIFKFVSSSLNIDKPIVPRRSDKGRTAAAYRSKRRERSGELLDESPAASPVVLKKVAGPRRRGLLSQAIIEEEDSDF